MIRAVPRELTIAEHLVATCGPMFVTYEIIGTTTVDAIHPRSGFGVLEIYVCKRCGFVEWYCQKPEEIPIGPEYMTEDIDVSGDGPYR